MNCFGVMELFQGNWLGLTKVDHTGRLHCDSVVNQIMGFLMLQLATQQDFLEKLHSVMN